MNIRSGNYSCDFGIHSPLHLPPWYTFSTTCTATIYPHKIIIPARARLTWVTSIQRFIEHRLKPASYISSRTTCTRRACVCKPSRAYQPSTRTRRRPTASRPGGLSCRIRDCWARATTNTRCILSRGWYRRVLTSGTRVTYCVCCSCTVR